MALWKPTYAIKSGKSSHLAKVFLLLILGSVLSGCVSLYDPESSHEWHSDLIHTLQSNELASQTIFLSQASLHKITLWVNAVESPSPDAELTLKLFDLNQKPKYLLSVTQPLNACRDYQCSFTIPEKHYIPSGKYGIVLESTTSIHLWGNLLDGYPQGSFSVNSQTTTADLGFSLEYRYTLQSAVTDLFRFGRDLWLIFPTLALLITPGILILKVIRFPFPHDRSVALYLIISTSLAVIPIVMAWTSLLNIHWQAETVRILFYGCFLLILPLSIRNLRAWLSKIHIDDLFLFVIFILALIIRLLMSRNLVAPAWVDSVHHSLITHLILQDGNYPTSYEPYLNITTTSYHSGFHANLAIFTWLSALPLPTSMLVFGQILNVLAIYSAYTFTLAFYPNRLAGLIAALLVAFFSPMPAYYTSWGRYTQLCGLLILPTPTFLFRRRLSLSVATRSSEITSALVLISLLFSGLIIIHYRVSYFFALLLGLSALEKFVHSSNQNRGICFFRLLSHLGIISFLTLLLSAAWLPEAFTTLLLPKFNAWNQSPSTPESIPFNLLTAALGKIILVLAGLGFVFEILRRSWSGIILSLWIALCFATIYLSYFLSRGVGFLNMTSVTIGLYLPLSALAAQGTTDTLKWLNRFIKPKPRWLLPTLSFCITLITAMIGGQSLIPLLNPVTMLVRADDLKAMDFIRSATTSDQKFLIHPFLWGYGLYAGSDGGSWIPALAQRATIPPPVLLTLSNSSDQVHQINQVSQKVLEKPRDAFWIANLMQQNGLQYLYLGGRGGSISPWEIFHSPYFKLIYHEGRVYIFKLQFLQSHP